MFTECKKLNSDDLAACCVCQESFVFNHGSQKHFYTYKNTNGWHLCGIFHIVGKNVTI